LGFGLMLIGVLGSSAFSVDEKLVLPRGEEGGAYGIAVSYQGMENDISVPKNRLKLNLEDAGESYQVYPELYFSQRLNGIFRKPFIQRNLLYDLYFSPEQVQDMNGSEGLILTKGETRTIGEYTFTFHDFDMGSHGTNPEMMVAVNIDVEHNGSISSIRPAVQVVTGESGQETVDIPAEFGNDENTYKASIKRIIADQGAVALNIPGLLQQGPPDRLILAITRKPVINLVWIGTSLILLGTIIVFVRRRSELAA
jgi:cytochrome c-type biogenesis protein CcmF